MKWQERNPKLIEKAKALGLTPYPGCVGYAMGLQEGNPHYGNLYKITLSKPPKFVRKLEKEDTEDMD
jgi:hypothetical protein